MVFYVLVNSQNMGKLNANTYTCPSVGANANTNINTNVYTNPYGINLNAHQIAINPNAQLYAGIQDINNRYQYYN
ncbi:hypothetical protein DLAC_02248 [Tieghemostelium lacteum]|uniref:Uncharacterized protein n=1 Tax=Tieghemostelium lacteum TaxID=361077 RepID=A0A152A4G8_TIELA|nr:hypothetical protein DLAC_02248 [Tieghemostelium lacteum]|eukprot:KYR01143.1 hypothetical protein DLAC_02248 [Tieghemostelium lacteum]